ncbi:hypothetical protein SY88_03500 [Clostridiales bacterium PH28_bin88]|nr:hypothetical protein SY88_03500 [Clostridiales bacterium PH28_bin88]
MQKVSVEPVPLGKHMGYDVRVLDEGATLQDYLAGMEEAIEKLPLTRRRCLGNGCRGCDACCGERIPLTSIDLLRIYHRLSRDFHQQKGFLSVGISATKASACAKGLAQAKFSLETLAWHQALRRYGYVVAEGRKVDIIVRTGEDGRCVFLEPHSRLCGIYPVRPLVCRTYICCPQTARVERLRAEVVNLGEDQLVRDWLLDAAVRGAQPDFHEGYVAAPARDDWPPTPFAEKRDYAEVLLKDVCSTKLWQQLRS